MRKAPDLDLIVVFVLVWSFSFFYWWFVGQVITKVWEPLKKRYMNR